MHGTALSINMYEMCSFGGCSAEPNCWMMREKALAHYRTDGWRHVRSPRRGSFLIHQIHKWNFIKSDSVFVQTADPWQSVDAISTANAVAWHFRVYMLATHFYTVWFAYPRLIIHLNQLHFSLMPHHRSLNEYTHWNHIVFLEFIYILHRHGKWFSWSATIAGLKYVPRIPRTYSTIISIAFSLFTRQALISLYLMASAGLHVNKHTNEFSVSRKIGHLTQQFQNTFTFIMRFQVLLNDSLIWLETFHLEQKKITIRTLYWLTAYFSGAYLFISKKSEGNSVPLSSLLLFHPYLHSI